jgi:hypothetical protein
MKKQLILLFMSAFIMVITFSVSPVFAGYQHGFNFIISPVVFSEPHPQYFGTSYVYSSYPVRPIKTVGIVESRPSHEVVYVRQAEPVFMGRYRGANRHYRHW